MLRPIAISMFMASLGTLCAQAPSELRLPRVGGDRFDSKREAAAVADPIASYQNRREAALAAFQEGYKAAVVQHNRPRAIRLLLVALRRDPEFAPALFDLAVLCSQENRWRDAIAFLQEAQKQATADSSIRPLVEAELNRVEAIESMESTPAGKKQREFDIEFVAAMNKSKDPIALNQALRIDGTRWEAPALAGILYADLGGVSGFSASAAELEKAIPLADKARADRLKSAAKVARDESVYLKDKSAADGHSGKQEHAQAAQLYAQAWGESRQHWDTALDAVTEYLLVDDTAAAVPLLSDMRDSAPPALRAKALAMLKELGAISLGARRAAERAPAPETPQPKEPAVRIREFVGKLTNTQMDLAVKREPDLLNDKTPVTFVPDDEIGGGNSDLMVQSTQSVFALYQRNLTAVAPPSGAAPEQARPDMPAAPPKDTQPAAVPAPRASDRLGPSPLGPAPTAAAGSTSRGAEQPVTIRSIPSGATLLLDDTLNCVAPCQPALTPGRHTLLATLAGYRDARRIFYVEKDKGAPVDVTLDAKSGWLNVESEIPGAPVFLDGVKTDKRTPARFTLSEGTHEVAVEVDARRSVKTVTITDNGLARLKF